MFCLRNFRVCSFFCLRYNARHLAMAMAVLLPLMTFNHLIIRHGHQFLNFSMASKLSDTAATSPTCTIWPSDNLTICQSHSPGCSTKDVFSFSIACIWLFCRLPATVREVAVRIGNILVQCLWYNLLWEWKLPPRLGLGLQFSFLESSAACN